MNYFIFILNTGDYQGIRLSRPTPEETNLIGIECTEENIAKLDSCVIPKLVHGEIIEAATPEEIEQHNRSKVPSSVSSLGFWMAVFELLSITEEYVKSHVEQMEDIGMRTRIMIMLNKAQEFDRSNPFLNQMAENLGVTQEHLDQIFIVASTM